MASNSFMSNIVVGKQWKSVVTLLPSKDVVVITDSNVHDIYGDGFPPFPVITLHPGEKSKSLDVIEKLAGELVELGIERNGFILAIGGGVVCDIVGFLASIYMRGIRFGYISTSLLSQVDASVGGKNGVDVKGAKNLLGCFTQPEFVICDPNMLKTLTQEEYLSGLSEMIKTGLILDSELVDTLMISYDSIMNRDVTVISPLIAQSIRLKSQVVACDEKEMGMRRILNFGHTFGHAIEMIEECSHGFAVAAGMSISIELSFKYGYLSEGDRSKAIRVLTLYGLYRKVNIPVRIISRYLSFDKKREDDKINFVFLLGIGKAEVRQVPIEELVNSYVDVLNTL